MNNKSRQIMGPFYSMVLEAMITNQINLQKLSIVLIWTNFLQMISFSFVTLCYDDLKFYADNNMKWYEGY